MKYFLAIMLSVGIVTAAYAGGFMMLHVGSSDGNGGGAPASGALLLEDNVSILLLEDNVSNFCLESGC